MRNDIIAIICPDIHGRKFWKEVANDYDGSVPFILLGDYLDPYPNEGITPEDAENNFKELWDFIKKWDNVIPLLGNHDLSYIDKLFRCCRYSFHNGTWYGAFLRENSERFKLAYQLSNDDTTFLLTHAGVHPEWLQQNDFEQIYDADYINSLYTSQIHCFADYSYYRGGNYWETGSPVWADIREFEPDNLLANPEIGMPRKLKQIVGHTMLSKDKLDLEDICCIDSQQVFVITKENKIEKYYN